MKEKIEQIRQLALQPDSHLFLRYLDMTIGQAASSEVKNYGRNPKERPAIALIEIVMSTNRKYVTHVEPYIIKLEKTNLKTFNQLQEKLSKYSIEQLYNYWGHHDSRKYGVLCNLLDAIRKLRNKYEIDDDYILMNTWAKETNINDFEKDIIGRIKYVGIAAFQHLRMNYGVNTAKPDRQVKEVLKNEFGFKGNDKKSIIAIEHISRITGYSPLELDQMVFCQEKGQPKQRFSSCS